MIAVIVVMAVIVLVIMVVMMVIMPMVMIMIMTVVVVIVPVMVIMRVAMRIMPQRKVIIGHGLEQLLGRHLFVHWLGLLDDVIDDLILEDRRP